MTEWSDPQIIVSIATGAFGTISSLGTLSLSVLVFRKQSKQSRNKAAWEEYRDTVYDLLFSALRNLEEWVKRCRRSSGETEGKGEGLPSRIQIEASECLNEIELSCVKADRHNASIERNWTELAEARNRIC